RLSDPSACAPFPRATLQWAEHLTAFQDFPVHPQVSSSVRALRPIVWRSIFAIPRSSNETQSRHVLRGRIRLLAPSVVLGAVEIRLVRFQPAIGPWRAADPLDTDECLHC